MTKKIGTAKVGSVQPTNVTIQAVGPVPTARDFLYACRMTTKHALMNDMTVSFVLSSGEIVALVVFDMRKLYHKFRHSAAQFDIISVNMRKLWK